MAEVIMDWVAKQGFPIAVAVYLLTRIETKIDKLITVIAELCTELKK